MECLKNLCTLAEQRRIAVLDYRKPTDEAPTRRWVEPYRLEYSNEALLALCWQVKPDVTDGPHSWRNFRVDRMLGVYDSGRVFEPRAEVTMHAGEATPFRFGANEGAPAGEPPPSRPRDAAKRASPGTLAAVNRYYQFVEAALLDGKADASEKETAHVYASYLSLDQLRAAHAQLYLSILRELLLDGTIDYQEEEYLRKVRRALKALGWEP